MNAILVSVNYTDCLRLTLPYNRHHFDRILVVTDPTDYPNVRPVCEANDAETYTTTAFYEDGADFNKGKALEEGLDLLGREGWLCIMDADVLWPAVVKLDWILPIQSGLYTPRRRMHPTVPLRVPDESTWADYPFHRQEREFAGYSQIFHASDPHLPNPPWHQTDWRHAGGADSFFQALWPDHLKVRPPFEVLHLGPPGVNWCGVGRESRLRELRARRKPGPDRFRAEKL